MSTNIFREIITCRSKQVRLTAVSFREAEIMVGVLDIATRNNKNLMF